MKEVNLKLVCVLIFIALLLYFGISFFIASQTTNPVARHIDVSGAFVSKDYQDVSFKTSDNLTLRGWLFNPKVKKFVIFIPGILDNRTNGGYYGVDLAREIIAKDFGVLMYDPRARGDSEGATRLKEESKDVIAAVNFLKLRGIDMRNIYILSYSTGTRATLLALPEIEGVGGVIVDSAPTDFKSVIKHVVTVEQGLPGLLLPGIFFWLNLSGVTLDSEQILTNVAASSTPILIVHTKNDLSVPLENSQQLLKANNKNQLVVFPKGSHIEAYKFNPDLYRKVLFKFLQIQ